MIISSSLKIHRNFRVLGVILTPAREADAVPPSENRILDTRHKFFLAGDGEVRPLCMGGDNGVSSERVKAVVITGGESPDTHAARRWLDGAQLIVAADSGLETAHRYGVRAHVVVGDFDSLSDETLLAEYGEEEVRRFASAKDDTDTEIGLRVAWESGADEVVLIGGGGGRLDHLLAIVTLFEREPRPSVWITANEVVRPIDDSIVERGSPGTLVSFFPLGCEQCRMESSGLKWPLDELAWSRGDAGVSNEFTGHEVRVTMIEGRLLMTLPLLERR